MATAADDAEGQKRSRRRVGDIERSVRRELKTVTGPDVGMRGTLRAMALLLARAIDSYSGQLSECGISASELSAVTKAYSELRSTMTMLMEVGDEGSAAGGSKSTALPAPVWDSAKS